MKKIVQIENLSLQFDPTNFNLDPLEGRSCNLVFADCVYLDEEK